jgi:hypothetical protein
MTRLRIAFLFVAVLAGAYAALILIAGQLVHFGVAAAVCAGSSVAAGLIAYAGRVRHKAVARGRAATSGHRYHQAATATDRQCPFCGDTRQKLSDSTRSVERQGARHARRRSPQG